jgi:hypothetical protein
VVRILDRILKENALVRWCRCETLPEQHPNGPFNFVSHR